VNKFVNFGVYFTFPCNWHENEIFTVTFGVCYRKEQLQCVVSTQSTVSTVYFFINIISALYMTSDLPKVMVKMHR
jgi:hypothetical protein